MIRPADRGVLILARLGILEGPDRRRRRPVQRRFRHHPPLSRVRARAGLEGVLHRTAVAVGHPCHQACRLAWAGPVNTHRGVVKGRRRHARAIHRGFHHLGQHVAIRDIPIPQPVAPDHLARLPGPDRDRDRLILGWHPQIAIDIVEGQRMPGCAAQAVAIQHLSQDAIAAHRPVAVASRPVPGLARVIPVRCKDIAQVPGQRVRVIDVTLTGRYSDRGLGLAPEHRQRPIRAPHPERLGDIRPRPGRMRSRAARLRGAIPNPQRRVALGHELAAAQVHEGILLSADEQAVVVGVVQDCAAAPAWTRPVIPVCLIERHPLAHNGRVQAPAHPRTARRVGLALGPAARILQRQLRLQAVLHRRDLDEKLKGARPPKGVDSAQVGHHLPGLGILGRLQDHVVLREVLERCDQLRRARIEARRHALGRPRAAILAHLPISQDRLSPVSGPAAEQPAQGQGHGHRRSEGLTRTRFDG